MFQSESQKVLFLRKAKITYLHRDLNQQFFHGSVEVKDYFFWSLCWNIYSLTMLKMFLILTKGNFKLIFLCN